MALCDIESFQKIHKVGGAYQKSPWYQEFTDLPSHGVFTLVGNKEHSVRRRVLARPFSKTYLMEHWEKAIRVKCALAVEKIKEGAVRGDTDVFKWFKFMASDIMSLLAFGESFGNLDSGKVRLGFAVVRAFSLTPPW